MAQMTKARTAKNPLKITDTTLRDGHQSMIATRLRTEDMVAIAETIDNAGFHSIEMWGGATFDVTTRYLAEDPWERIHTLKKLMPNTPFQMLLRGQNLVGYRNYPDDVVEAFIHHAAEVGIDIFRIFDALNDERNLDVSIRTVKECGGHAQAAICYSVTEGRLGGEIYSVDYFVDKALLFQDMGADSICIKDMAGIITPYDAETLVKALKAKLRVPLQLHTHYTSGMASMAVIKAAEAGVDIVDSCLAPMALRSSQPAVEPIVGAFRDTDRDTGLDLPYLVKLGQSFEAVAPKYRDYLDTTKFAPIDTGVLRHQVPGGMISNLVAQLREADALDRLQEVYEELPRTREDMGYPPLVTPTSQIVGVQAVNNVLFGEYTMISDQVKDYVYGLYGRPPARISEKLVELALKGYSRGQTPITCRAADVLKPEMEEAKAATKDIAKDLGDVLIYALYPTTGMRFLRWKYGLEEIPAEAKGKTLDDIRREDELIAELKAGPRVEKNGHGNNGSPARGPGTRSFNVFIGEQYFKVEVEPTDGGGYGLRSMAPGPAAPRSTTAPDARLSRPNGPTPAVKPKADSVVLAPIPGLVLKYLAAVGDEVKAGDPVVILEAMKMENSLPSPVDGRVMSLPVAVGTKVAKDDVLAVIG